VVEELRQRGHDVLTAQDDGHRQTPDSVILAPALALGRIVVTFNRWDYERLDRRDQAHSGILSATPDRDAGALAARIDAALAGHTPGCWCIRVNKPP